LGIPRWLHRASRYLLAFALIVFGIAHSLLTFIPCPAGFLHWFWTVFGVVFISAGVSLPQFQRRLCVGLMFALWTVTPSAASRNSRPDKWSDVFIVVALWGGSWALARTPHDPKEPQ
jgi:hypothetical protein